MYQCSTLGLINHLLLLYYYKWILSLSTYVGIILHRHLHLPIYIYIYIYVNILQKEETLMIDRDTMMDGIG
jgi:hypothetical protein